MPAGYVADIVCYNKDMKYTQTIPKTLLGHVLSLMLTAWRTHLVQDTVGLLGLDGFYRHGLNNPGNSLVRTA